MRTLRRFWQTICGHWKAPAWHDHNYMWVDNHFICYCGDIKH